MPDIETPTTEAPDAIAQADAQADSQADAVLARIVGDESDKSSGDHTRDEHGRFSKLSEPSKPEAKAADAPKPTPEGANSADYRKALTALQFDKVPQKTIDALTPDEIIDWGTQRAKAHAETKRLIEKRKTETPKPVTTEATRAEPDWAKAVEPFAKSLTDTTGVDSTEPLKALAKQIYEQAQTALKDELAAQRESIDAIQGQFKLQQAEAAREKLTEKYELADDDRWEMVLDYRQSDKNEYDSEREAVEAACRQVFADEIISKYEANLKVEHSKRAQGQSTTQTQKAPPKAKTQDDQETDLLSAILDGRRDDVQRLSLRSAHRGASEAMALEMAS